MSGWTGGTYTYTYIYNRCLVVGFQHYNSYEDDNCITSDNLLLGFKDYNCYNSGISMTTISMIRLLSLLHGIEYDIIARHCFMPQEMTTITFQCNGDNYFTMQFKS